ncbi:MAG: veratrol--corrinoid protein metyltransferase [Clostridiales bacterium]|nr:veratrol--corrinoid protein metyltransferase [Clostridiales bacterium]
MTMTERENLLRVANGQEPAWLPRKGIVPYADVDPEEHKPCCLGAMPMLFPPKTNARGGRIDIFGVEYEATDSTDGLQLPMPNHFILDDVTKWRDVIKVPSLEGIDWRAIAEKSVEHIDRKESCVSMGTHVGYFQHLMNFMGFTEGLIALQEEPEEVMELYAYLAEFYETISKKLIEYIKPDFYGLTDDTATARSPFISNEMYRKIVKPFHASLAKIGVDHDCFIEMHNCGRCEDVIDDWREFGVSFWNPAQVMNDLPGIKKKYGNSLILNGCWDSSGPAGWPGAKEELVRQAVRDCIDAYAPGGGFCFWASLYGSKDNEKQARQHAFWITDEYNKYGRTFYQRQG